MAVNPTHPITNSGSAPLSVSPFALSRGRAAFSPPFGSVVGNGGGAFR